MRDPARNDDIGPVLFDGCDRIQLLYVFAVGDGRLTELCMPVVYPRPPMYGFTSPKQASVTWNK